MFAFALVVGSRLDLTSEVQVTAPVEGGKPGEETLKGEHEIGEEVARAHAMKQVTLALGAGFGTPARLLLLAVLLYLVGRYVGGRPTLRRTMSLASYAALPLALEALILVGAALRRPRLTPADLGLLSGEALTRLPVNPFLLWGVVLCALGFPMAASVSRTKAVLTVTVCFVLLLCLKAMSR